VSASELSFPLPGTGSALFTTRAHGNMSSVSGEGSQHGAQARERLRKRIGAQWLVRGKQVHGAIVELVGDGLEAPPGAPPIRAHVHIPASDAAAPVVEADGHATAVDGVGLMVLAADCLPVVLGTPGAVVALHAGWRGLLAGVIEEGVRVLGGPSGASDAVAVIGPGAGACCYEVGEEVHAAFGGIHRKGSRIDLKAIARERLLASGVAEVRDLGLCTICDERFFSHRREGERAGRQAGVAWLS
jgi:polyphenol oxidase